MAEMAEMAEMPQKWPKNGPKMAQILKFKLLSKKTFILGDLSKVSLNLTKL